MLDVRDLSVTYRSGRRRSHALDRVSLTVGGGEAVGLVGESGSGKSTLARAIFGLTPASDGSIRFKGEELTRVPFRRRRALSRELQIVFQDPYSALDPHHTVLKILAEPLYAAGHGRAATRRRAEAMLARVHLPADALDRYPSAFSGGQRQRIAIARALMPEPDLVICDEAVSALDVSVQAQIVNLLEELAAESHLALMFISHDLDVVRHLCDRIVVLYRGRVMEVGDAERLTRAPAHPYTRALLAAAPVPDPRLQRRRRGEVTRAAEAGDPGHGCPFHPRCPSAIDRCRIELPEPRVDGSATVACHRAGEWQDDASTPVCDPL